MLNGAFIRNSPSKNPGRRVVARRLEASYFNLVPQIVLLSNSLMKLNISLWHFCDPGSTSIRVAPSDLASVSIVGSSDTSKAPVPTFGPDGVGLRVFLNLR